ISGVGGQGAGSRGLITIMSIDMDSTFKGLQATSRQTLPTDPRPPTPVLARWDACTLDGREIDSWDDWAAIVHSERLASVNGAFALAWREADGAVALARDAIGERSLFYAQVEDRLVFAPTIRAVLETGFVPRRLNLAAVAAYLTYAYIPGRETLVEGIYKLLPGEVVRMRNGQLTSSTLWSLPAEAEPGIRSDEEELRSELRRRLERAVSRRLPRGEPVGAFLSGGLDSSLVVALARRLHADRVLTYSIHFGDGYANELPFSSLVAGHCGTEHRTIELSPRTVMAHLDESIAMLSDPIGDPLTVPNALLFREAASDVRVVLNGEGGDPCFGGPKNLPMLLAELLGDGAGCDQYDRYSRERSYLRAHQKCYDDLSWMLAPRVREAIAGDRLERQLTEHFEDPRWTSFITKLMAINVTFKGAHHILPKVEWLSAPFGVAARSPLFDREIVEMAFAIPPQLKLRGSVEKYLLKQAVKDLLPAAIIARPKSGMLVPVEAWFTGVLLPYARERLLDGLSGYELIERDYLERLLAGRLGGLRPRRGAKLWLLVTLESWLRTVFQGAGFGGRGADQGPGGRD
ncbi:MAG TPA: asparagine synthase C-terminal domain-containing protein, partial [Blastocatellia bacterium]|nr:asparagine synthase C-terminal domain-containing protein [Blastocatellia bacterium]